MKRIIDIILAFSSLFVLSPLMLTVAALIYLDDRGSLLYKQVRIGFGGREFKILKFRSMVLNADKIGGYSTLDGDPRITKIGRFIRRTSLDELPQLLNVLLGDMSIVGPRPDVPAQRSLYTADEWKVRHQVKPGITGLAQAKRRSEATLEERKSMDLYYAEHSSLWFDIKIIIMTIRQIITKGGN